MNQQLAKLIERLETELLQPDVRASAKKLNGLLADDFLEFGASGRQYRKQDIVTHLPMLANAHYTIHDFAIVELSGSIVLATYRAEKEEKENGRKTFSLRSSLWQKRNGAWQMLFHQGTPVSEQPHAAIT